MERQLQGVSYFAFWFICLLTAFYPINIYPNETRRMEYKYLSQQLLIIHLRRIIVITASNTELISLKLHVSIKSNEVDK